MDSQIRPVSEGERIAVLDAIRGFALLGIFIMNMPWFGTSFFAGFIGADLWPQWWNSAAETAEEVLFAGKFNSMFSMLFAIGFTIQLQRLLEREPERAYRIYLRRIFWLLVFGIAHACLLWTGDVLHMYAVLGILLLLLRKVPDRVIVGLLALCLLYGPIFGIVRVLVSTPADVQAFIEFANAQIAADNLAYGAGTYWQIVERNVQAMILTYTHPKVVIGQLSFYILFITTMLIGLLLGRRRFFQTAAQNLQLVRRVQWGALLVGAITGLVYGVWFATVENPAQPTPWRVVAGTAFGLCRIALMIFYVAWITRAMHNDRWRRRLEPITLAGRMPLTNYLMQSLIGTVLFLGWGVGLWGKVGPALDLVLAVAIFFLIQVPFSRFWLRRWRLGPMEYLWRVLTYGRPALGGLRLRPAV